MVGILVVIAFTQATVLVVAGLLLSREVRQHNIIAIQLATQIANSITLKSSWLREKDTAIRLQERCNRLTSELSEMKSARDFSEDLIASIETMIHNHQNQSDLPPSVNLADGVPINE